MGGTSLLLLDRLSRKESFQQLRLTEKETQALFGTDTVVEKIIKRGSNKLLGNIINLINSFCINVFLLKQNHPSTSASVLDE